MCLRIFLNNMERRAILLRHLNLAFYRQGCTDRIVFLTEANAISVYGQNIKPLGLQSQNMFRLYRWQIFFCLLGLSMGARHFFDPSDKCSSGYRHQFLPLFFLTQSRAIWGDRGLHLSPLEVIFCTNF